MTPTTWPVGSTPTSVRPSTSAALVIMGALAAMTTWAHDSSLPSFMARPSRSSARSEVWVWRRKARALRRARGSAADASRSLEMVDDVGADHPLGRAVDAGGDHGAGDGGAQVDLLHVVGDRALPA